MKTKRIYFICLTTANFFCALYYIHRVRWDEHTEKILVWAKKGKTKPEFQPYENLFDRFFYVDFADYHFPFRSQFDKLLKAGRLFRFTELAGFMRESVNNNVLVCFNDWDCCTTKYIDFFSRYDHNEIVMMDEGTALYFDGMVNPPSRAARILYRIVGTRSSVSVGADPKINVIMARHPDKLPGYKRSGHRVIPQNDIFRDTEFLQQIQNQMKGRLPKKQDKWVLWLGQPVEELGLGEHQQEAMISIFQTFIKENYRILIKPHPREHSKKYLNIAKMAGIEAYMTVMDLGELYWIPIEAYISLLAPDAIACFFSTAAGQIRDLGYVCDTWYCYDFLGKDLENDFLRGEMKRVSTFRVHDQKELEEKLKIQSSMNQMEQISGEMELPGKNLNQDIAYFEQFMKEKDDHE